MDGTGTRSFFGGSLPIFRCVCCMLVCIHVGVVYFLCFLGRLTAETTDNRTRDQRPTVCLPTCIPYTRSKSVGRRILMYIIVHYVFSTITPGRNLCLVCSCVKSRLNLI